MVKIDVKIFKNFVERVSLKGEIKKIEMTFGVNGIEVYSMTPNKTNMNLAILKKEAFEEYNVTEEYKIGIKNTGFLLSLLSSFTGIINIGKQGENIMTVYNEKKTAGLTIVKPEFIETKFPKTVGIFDKFDGGVKIDSNVLKENVKNARILGEQITEINCNGGTLTLTAGSATSDNIVEKYTCDYKIVSAKFGDILFKPVELLPEICEMSILENDGPIQLKINDEAMLVKMLVSPFVEESEE